MFLFVSAHYPAGPQGAMQGLPKIAFRNAPMLAGSL
jgi:hypothetical protein